MGLLLSGLLGLMPLILMLIVATVATAGLISLSRLWRLLIGLSGISAALILVVLLFEPQETLIQGWLAVTTTSLVIALLVQMLGTVIASFSSRYLQGEPNQDRYIAALALLLAAVHGLLLADSWLLLIIAWAVIGLALQPLLCFYTDRPFAQLAAHKKRLADRLASILLLAAALFAWQASGTLSISELNTYLELNPSSLWLQTSAVLLVLAVILRTALLPVHGWLVQVMEAPTPVSALLHEGVVNLSGYVLISFAPLLEHATFARWLLFAMGLVTAVMAGMVMLTRISIKVRLAWSTLAQMGFMLMQCALGLYTLALLHLLGHSVYKAHAFLSASETVRNTGFAKLGGATKISTPSLWFAPLLAGLTIISTSSVTGIHAWPWWWSMLLAVAWAPLLWLPANSTPAWLTLLRGVGVILLLTLAAKLLHLLPLAPEDAPNLLAGPLALAAFIALYVLTAMLQLTPAKLSWARRWSYAGFYLDEQFTRLTLKFWPSDWSASKTGSKGV